MFGYDFFATVDLQLFSWHCCAFRLVQTDEFLSRDNFVPEVQLVEQCCPEALVFGLAQRDGGRRKGLKRPGRGRAPGRGGGSAKVPRGGRAASARGKGRGGGRKGRTGAPADGAVAELADPEPIPLEDGHADLIESAAQAPSSAGSSSASSVSDFDEEDVLPGGDHGIASLDEQWAVQLIFMLRYQLLIVFNRLL